MKWTKRKELEGRYAALELLGKNTRYAFTEPEFERYDALLSGYSTEGELLTTGVEEYKTYNDPQHPRWSTGTTTKIYYDFHLDYDKCEAVYYEGQSQGGTSLITSYFMDYIITWDLNKTDWSGNTSMLPVNKYGWNHGAEKEEKLQSCLPLDVDTPGGPVRKIPMPKPEEFWPHIAELIKKDHPDYTPSWEK